MADDMRRQSEAACVLSSVHELQRLCNNQD